MAKAMGEVSRLSDHNARRLDTSAIVMRGQSAHLLARERPGRSQFQVFCVYVVDAVPDADKRSSGNGQLVRPIVKLDFTKVLEGRSRLK
jgi:hypothetical protein